MKRALLVVLFALATFCAPLEARASTAQFVGYDPVTQGLWAGGVPGVNTYGWYYYNMVGIGSGSTNGSGTPTGVSVTINGATTHTWATSQTNASALCTTAQTTTCSNRTAAQWFTTSTMTVNVVTNGSTYLFSMYLLDWNDASAVRVDGIKVTDTNTGALLDYHLAGSFVNGTYISWNVNGNVTFTIDKAFVLSNGNASISAVFLDQPGTAMTSAGASASFVGTNTSAAGNWVQVSGCDGFLIPNDASSVNPSYVTPSWSPTTWTTAWNSTGTGDASYGTATPAPLTTPASTTNAAALYVSPSSSTRISSYYHAGGFNLDINPSNSLTHTLSLYFQDINSAAYADNIYITDALSGAVLDSEAVSSFSAGKYLTWTFSKHIIVIVVAQTGGNDSAFSGVFWGAVDEPSVSLSASVSPTGAQAPGTDLTYTTTFTNGGCQSSSSLVFTFAIPANTYFKVGTASATTTGTSLTGYTATYSSDGGSTWTYTPTSAGGGAPSGYDASVTNVKWTFTGTLSQTSGSNSASLSIAVRIK